jgi:hypothetical protein
MKKIIIAPISANNPQAQSNYAHEMSEADNFRLCMWDGEVNGKDEVGDFFGFVDIVNDTIEVTRVIAVLGSSAGRRHWSGAHSNQANGKLKNVLILDCFYKNISYSQFKQDAGYKPNLVLSGTKRLDWPY